MESKENPCDEELEPFRVEGKIVSIDAERVLVPKGRVLVTMHDGFTSRKPAKCDIVEGFKQEGDEDAGYVLRFKGSRGLWEELKKDLSTGLQKIANRKRRR